MEYLFLALTVLSAAGLTLGLIRPGLVMPGGNRATRGRAFLLYGLATSISLILFVMTADSSLWRGRMSQPTPSGTMAGAVANNRLFSRLTIESVSSGGGKVTITGATDLPRGTRLSVDFDIAGDNTSEMAVSEETTVENGRFSIAIVSPGNPRFRSGSLCGFRAVQPPRSVRRCVYSAWERTVRIYPGRMSWKPSVSRRFRLKKR